MIISTRLEPPLSDRRFLFFLFKSALKINTKFVAKAVVADRKGPNILRLSGSTFKEYLVRLCAYVLHIYIAYAQLFETDGYIFSIVGFVSVTKLDLKP